MKNPQHGWKVFAISGGVFLALAAVLFSARHAAAVDRPGAPINVISFPDMTPGKLPAIALGFRNTAKEEVTFWVEWKVNGQLKGDPQTTLPRTRMECRRNVSCTGFLGTTTKSDDPGKSQDIIYGITQRVSAPIGAWDKGFRINDVDWDTEYCFHVRARKVDGGIVSENWSPWACGRTPPAPPVPAIFPRPVITFFPGETGGVAGRSMDGLVPDRVLVEWQNTGGAAHYEIEGVGKPYKNSWQYANNIPVDAKNSKQAALFDVSGSAAPYFYTVCAVNIRGRTCSARVSTSLLTGKENLGVKAGPGVSTPIPAAKLAAGVAVNTPTPGAAVRKAGNLAFAGQPNAKVLAFAEPAANARAVPGALRVRLLPTTATGDALLQLTTLDGWPPLVKSWRAPISTLVDGTVLPASVTGDRLGRWSMTAKSDVGPTSSAVVFQLAR